MHSVHVYMGHSISSIRFNWFLVGLESMYWSIKKIALRCIFQIWIIKTRIEIARKLLLLLRRIEELALLKEGVFYLAITVIS